MAIMNSRGKSAAADARVQLAQTGYRICANGEYSAEFDFGEPAEWEAPDGVRYVAFVDVQGGREAGEAEVEADDVESQFEYWLYAAVPVDREPEDIGEFEMEGDGEGDGESEEAEDDDEGEDDDDGGDDGEPAAA